MSNLAKIKLQTSPDTIQTMHTNTYKDSTTRLSYGVVRDLTALLRRPRGDSTELLKGRRLF